MANRLQSSVSPSKSVEVRLGRSKQKQKTVTNTKTGCMSRSSVITGNQTESVCSPQVLSLLNQCKFLEELLKKSKQIIEEKNQKINFLLNILSKREQTLREFYYQNVRLKEECRILIEQISHFENQMDENGQDSQEGSFQCRSPLMRHNELLAAYQDDIDIDNMTYEQLLQLEEHIGHVNRGLSKNQIKSIEKIDYNKMEQKTEVICTICQQEYQQDDKCRILCCNHYYHSKCIKQWLLKEKYCPVCKTEQS